MSVVTATTDSGGGTLVASTPGATGDTFYTAVIGYIVGAGNPRDDDPTNAALFDSQIDTLVANLAASTGSTVYVQVFCKSGIYGGVSGADFTGTGSSGSYTVNGVHLPGTSYKKMDTAPNSPSFTSDPSLNMALWYVVLFLPGSATSTLTIAGNLQLAGQTAEVVVNGISYGTQAVANNGTVSISVSNLPQGQKFSDLSVASVGLPFTAKAQMLRPATEQDLKSPTGAALGKLRRGYQWALDCYQVSQLKVGVDFGSTLQPVTFTTDGGYAPELAIASGATFTGVQWGELIDTSSFDAMLCWQCDTGVTCMIRAASIFLEGSER